MNKKTEALKTGRELIEAETFKRRHIGKGNAFIRRRILMFGRMILLIMRKSLKSLQLTLNELALEEGNVAVMASAFKRAGSPDRLKSKER